MNQRGQRLPKGLVLAVLAMTLVVMTLGGAVLVIKLRPEEVPTSVVERTLYNWQQAVEQNPESDAAQTGLGLALLQADRPSEARAAFEAALELNEQNWMANFQLALLLRAEAPDRAVELFEASAGYAAQGDKAVPYIALGDFLMERGDAKGARDAYRQSIADVPYLFDSHLGLAKAYESLGEIKAAIKEYKAAGRFAPGNAEIAAALDRLRDRNATGD